MKIFGQILEYLSTYLNLLFKRNKFSLPKLKLIHFFNILGLSISIHTKALAETIDFNNSANRTVSDFYKNNPLSPESIKKLTDSENAKTNAIYKKSKYKDLLTYYFSNRLDQNKIRQRSVLKNKDQIQLIDYGLGKKTEVLRIFSANNNNNNNNDERNNSVSLISNFQFKRNNSMAFVGYSLSSNEKYLAVFAIKAGSIDDYSIYVINLSNNQIIQTVPLISKGMALSWIQEDKFIFNDTNNLTQRLMMDLTKPNDQPIAINLKYLTSGDLALYCQNRKLYRTDGIDLNFNCNKISSIIRSNENFVELITNDDEFQIIRIQRNETEKKFQPTVLFQFQANPRLIKHIDGHFFIYANWGEQQSLLVINDQGQLIQKTFIPDYVNVKSFLRKNLNASIEISTESLINSDVKIEWDYKTNTFTPNILNESISHKIYLVKDGIQYQNQVILIPASDGTKLPTRLVSKKGLTLTANTPALLDIYGGFNSPGKFQPVFNPVIRDLFLKKNGLYVAPIIRGGDELGTNWYINGSVQNKMNTFTDFISVANFLILQGWTSKNKIITMGTSAGALNIMSAAFLSPDSFGLVIPVNGPYNMLGRDQLDPRYSSSWQQEYGNLSNPSNYNYILQYSPLELIPLQNFPNVFLVNGLNDSRVNSLHSIQMISRLREFDFLKDKVHSVFIKNAGHWIASDSYQDYIAWRENILIWTMIYEFLKW